MKKVPLNQSVPIQFPPDSKTRPKREQANKFEQFIEMDKYIDDAVARTEKMVLTNTTRVKQEVEDLF